MQYRNQILLFFYSLALGVVVWAVSFWATPAHPLQSPLIESVTFFLLSYLVLMAGFLTPIKPAKEKRFTTNKKVIQHVLLLLLASFCVRYIDLFYYRGLSVYNTIFENRSLISTPLHFYEIPFKIASVLKSCYFIPLLLYLNSKKAIGGKTFLLCVLVFLLPLLEAFLLGSRKTLFELLALLVIILFVYKKISLKNGLYVICGSIIFVTVGTTYILKQRVNIEYNSDKSKNELLTSRYNDLFPLNESFKNQLVNETKSNFEFNTRLITAHYGQYLNHGFFEMDDIIRNKNQLGFALGRHTFSQVFKPFSLDVNANPRVYTYVTFFGSFFLDFGWWALIVFFVFGMFQRVIFLTSGNNMYSKCLLPYLCLINFAIPFMCTIRGAGLYPLIGVAIVYFYSLKTKRVVT